MRGQSSLQCGLGPRGVEKRRDPVRRSGHSLHRQIGHELRVLCRRREQEGGVPHAEIEASWNAPLTFPLEPVHCAVREFTDLVDESRNSMPVTALAGCRQRLLQSCEGRREFRVLLDVPDRRSAIVDDRLLREAEAPRPPPGDEPVEQVEGYLAEADGLLRRVVA